MRTTYIVTYFIPSAEHPDLYRKSTVEITRNYTLTKPGLTKILQDQLGNSDLYILDFKRSKVNGLQYDLFLPCQGFQTSEDGTRAVVIEQAKDGRYVGLLHEGEDLQAKGKDGLPKPAEVKKSVRLSTIIKWAKNRVQHVAQQLTFKGV